jgi:hypothetical protein
MWRCLVVLAAVMWSRGVGSVHFLKAVVQLHCQHNQASSHEVLTSLVLLMMGIMMPKTCWDWFNSRNIHLIIVASVGSIIHLMFLLNHHFSATPPPSLQITCNQLPVLCMCSMNLIPLELKGLLKYLGQVAIWALRFQ